MSTIKSSTTTTTAYQVVADTTGTLVIQTGSTPTTAVTVDASQNVGVGTASITNPQSWNKVLQITSASSSGLYLNDGTANLSVAAYAGKMWFTSDANTRMIIDTSGNLLVNTTSLLGASGKITLLCTGDGITTRPDTNRTYNPGYFQNSSGTLVGYIQSTASATTFSTTSDYRLKENVQPMTGALEKIAQLRPVTYNWKIDGSSSQGFIAHELQAVVPDCVTGEKDAVNEDGSIKPQGIDTSFLVATLTAAIQELKADLDATKAELAALKGNS